MSSAELRVYLSDISQENQISLGRANTDCELKVSWEARVDY